MLDCTLLFYHPLLRSMIFCLLSVSHVLLFLYYCRTNRWLRKSAENYRIRDKTCISIRWDQVIKFGSNKYSFLNLFARKKKEKIKPAKKCQKICFRFFFRFHFLLLVLVLIIVDINHNNVFVNFSNFLFNLSLDLKIMFINYF